MAKDDMMLLAYKVLRYLYACNKSGKVTTFEDMFNAVGMSGIPRSYIAQILREMDKNEFVSGCNFIETKGGTVVTLSDSAGITLKGVEFLESNGRMKKASEAAGKAFEMILEGTVAVAMNK